MPELETRTVSDVPILRTGKGFRGQGCPEDGCDFTEGQLDALVDAYRATKGDLEPPVKLGHDDNQKLLQEDGYPAAGWVANLRRRGDRLYADLLNVPKKIAELIRAGAYRYVSVELNKDFEVNGAKYPLILTGLALLGADLPAVPGLGSIERLYQSLRMRLADGAHVFVFETDFALSRAAELTPQEIRIAQQLGIDSPEYRLRLRRQKLNDRLEALEGASDARKLERDGLR